MRPTPTHSETQRLLVRALVYVAPLVIAACCMTACVMRELVWLLRALALSASLGPPP